LRLELFRRVVLRARVVRDEEARRRLVAFRAAVFRPPRFAVDFFAVERRAVPRLAVVRLRPAVRRVPEDFFFAVERRRVVRFAPPDEAAPPLSGAGGGGVGLEGIGVGHTEPGSFCADQSVPWSSCMVPPQVIWAGRNSRVGISRSSRGRKTKQEP